MCLKLIKNIDTLERLPVNHTIFSKMAEECKEDYKKEFMGGKPDLKLSSKQASHNENYPKEEEMMEQKKFTNPLMANVAGAQVQKKGKEPVQNHLDINNFMPNPHKNQQQQQQEFGMDAHNDEEGGAVADSELEYCDIHNDRVKHFFCLSHKNICCRVCREMLHAKESCVVIDLYETEDIQGVLNDNMEDKDSRNLFEGNDEEDDTEDNNGDLNKSTNSV